MKSFTTLSNLITLALFFFGNTVSAAPVRPGSGMPQEVPFGPSNATGYSQVEAASVLAAKPSVINEWAAGPATPTVAPIVVGRGLEPAVAAVAPKSQASVVAAHGSTITADAGDKAALNASALKDTLERDSAKVFREEPAATSNFPATADAEGYTAGTGPGSDNVGAGQADSSKATGEEPEGATTTDGSARAEPVPAVSTAAVTPSDLNAADDSSIYNSSKSGDAKTAGASKAAPKVPA